MQIDPRQYYTPAEAASLLAVKESTVKDYCRAGKVAGVSLETKKIGPRHEWRLKGQSIIRIRQAWDLDT